MFNMFSKVGKVLDHLKTSPETTPQSYFYFAKIVPHTFIDMIIFKSFNSYSYSLAHNKIASNSKAAKEIYEKKDQEKSVNDVGEL